VVDTANDPEALVKFRTLTRDAVVLATPGSNLTGLPVDGEPLAMNLVDKSHEDGGEPAVTPLVARFPLGEDGDKPAVKQATIWQARPYPSVRIAELNTHMTFAAELAEGSRVHVDVEANVAIRQQDAGPLPAFALARS
jgi:hypothetical protein